jgi:uncharacterized membrane protein YdjX (TVP38/TMEM64 family)
VWPRPNANRLDDPLAFERGEPSPEPVVFLSRSRGERASPQFDPGTCVRRHLSRSARRRVTEKSHQAVLTARESTFVVRRVCAGVRRPPSVFVSARSRRRALGLLAGYVLLATFVTFGLPRLFPALADPVAVRTAIRSAGAFAPVVFLVVQALQVLLAPVPGQVLGFVAGYLFGVGWGTVLSVAGATAGGYVAFALARRYGRPVVERFVADEALALFDSFSSSHGDVALFLVFLIPGLPDDAICFLAGVSDVDTRSFLLASVVGRLPGYFLVALAGARLADARPAETTVLLLVLALVSATGYLVRGRVARWLGDGADDS